MKDAETKPLSVSRCSTPAIAAIVEGIYLPVSTNHKKIVYKKQLSKVEDDSDDDSEAEVLIYYWDSSCCLILQMLKLTHILKQIYL